jgi:serine/threonine-protein kinase
MTIAASTRLGAYEILGLLGAGGMGEVYRAKDPRLNREVAIKVLPEELFEGEERRLRFEREARVLASLNHPGIASIYAFEEIPSSSSVSSSSSRHILVMELAEGESLDKKILAGPLPLEETLSLARQIAEALEAAHEKGIVHRDLKPANVVVSNEGKVKLLDFGLAKAFENETAVSSPSISISPTLTARATAAGVILGTAAFMSPEQARGRPVDKRADVWAFGVVLFEMLTGQRLFQGETVSDTLAAVLRDPVDFGKLPPSTPPSVRVLLERCLERDPKQRLQAIGESRIALERTIAGTSGAMKAATEPGPAAGVAAASPERRALPWAIGAALGALAVFAFWMPWKKAPQSAPVRISAELGADASLVTDLGPSAVLSPDGSLLAFAAQKTGGGSSQVWVRRLDQLSAAPLAGTEGAQEPFFSPDAKWIGFFADGKLKKVSVTGGAAVVLCEAPNLRGACWTEDGTIVFLPNSGPNVALLKVPAAGGKPEPFTKLEEGEVTQRWPQILPGGKAVLYTGHATTSSGFEDANIVVQPLPKGPRKILQRGGYHGRYVPSGHVVYVHESTLFAAPFDVGRLELTGPPVPVVEGIFSTPNSVGSNFAFSNEGTLVYLPGKSVGAASPIHWMDRAGKTSVLRSTASAWNDIRFSPDGQKLAMDVTDGGQTDVWVYEWARDTMSRLTFDLAEDSHAAWSPDGKRIAFSSARADKAVTNLYWQRADGTGDVQRLSESKVRQISGSFHPGGRFLAFMEQDPKTNWDIMILPIEGDEASGFKPGKATVFLNSPFVEVWPEFSPDGKWLAYMSNESGRFEVYVRPFPGPGGKWQISTEGGAFPTWSRASRELFFGQDGKIIAVSYSADDASFHAEKPQPLSEGRYRPLGPFRAFDLHPDGKRFAILKPPDSQSDVRHDKVVFVFNFFDELRRVAGTGKK